MIQCQTQEPTDYGRRRKNESQLTVKAHLDPKFFLSGESSSIEAMVDRWICQNVYSPARPRYQFDEDERSGKMPMNTVANALTPRATRMAALIGKRLLSVASRMNMALAMRM